MADSIINHYVNVEEIHGSGYSKLYDLKNLISNTGTPDVSMNVQANAYAYIPFSDDQKTEIMRYTHVLVYINGSFNLSAVAQGSSTASSSVAIRSLSSAKAITKSGTSQSLTTGARRSSASAQSTFVDCGMYINTDGSTLDPIYDTATSPFNMYVLASGKYNGSSYNSTSYVNLSAKMTVDVLVYVFGYRPDPYDYFNTVPKVDLGDS